MGKKEDERLKEIPQGKAKPPHEQTAEEASEEGLLAERDIDGLVGPGKKEGNRCGRPPRVASIRDVGIVSQVSGQDGGRCDEEYAWDEAKEQPECKVAEGRASPAYEVKG